MRKRRSVKGKLQESYKDLGLLEAIDAFEQIRGLVVEESEKRPSIAKEALLELYQLILTMIQEEYLEGFKEEDKVWRLLGVIEEDLYRMTTHTRKILESVHKVQHLLSRADDKEEESSED